MSLRVHTLSNGVRVVCDPMPALETLALSVVAGGGARHEDAARSGWSHLLEHMVFKGAGSRSARDIVESVEAEGGQINAATGYERTSYQVRALAGGLPLGVAVIADLVQAPVLDAGDLSREQQVVGQEIAEAFDTPDDYVFEAAQVAAFADQALGRPVLGTVASVGVATPQDLAEWRSRLYAPAALVVSAAGAVDEDDLLRLAEQAFGGQAGSPALIADQATFIGGHQKTARRLEQAHIVLQLPAPGVRDEAYFALRILAEALGGGMASRLFQEARERRGLAYAIDAYAETYDDVGVLGVYAGCAAADAAETARISALQIRQMADSGVTAAELVRTKAQLKASLFMARESPLSRAEQAAAHLHVFGRLISPAELREGVESVTTNDVAALAGRLLAPGRVATSVLGPKAALGAGRAFEDALFG